MAGIYVHVPFCVKRCAYCDFHKSLDLKNIPTMVNTLVAELELRKDYLGNEEINTIYFGGGTPSVFEVSQLAQIIDAIYGKFSVSSDVEITMEANPDDLIKDYLRELTRIQINRLSIGVQSFDNEELIVLNRRHNKSQALEAIQDAQDLGLTNLSLDLIYGLPAQTIQMWEKNLDIVANLDVPHLSSYHLIYEKGTEMHRWKKQKKIIPVHEDTSVAMFKKLIERSAEMGYEHYEISNFAKEGMRSRHNSSYWKGDSYLGIGPSAHSFNGIERSWNVSNNLKYLNAVKSNSRFSETEILTLPIRYNEYVITSLRTKEGGDINLIEERFGIEFREYLEKNAERFVNNGELILEGNNISFSKNGIFLSDGIMSDLLWVKDE